MNEEIPLIPAVIAVLALTYFGFEVERRRNKLRSVFGVFDKKESKIAEALELLVESGQLRPYAPADHTVRLAAE